MLDLHGYTVHAAWKAFTEHVSDCYYANKKSTIVVTGHGQIGSEIIAWVHANKHTKSCSRMDPNTGAYKIMLHQFSKVKKNKAEPVNLIELYKKYNKD